MKFEKQQSVALRNYLKMRYIQARGNLMLAVCLTAVNILMLLLKFTGMFLFSVTVPYYAVLFGMVEETGTLFIPCLLFALAILAVYFLCWLFSKKNPGWMTAALVLFAIDTVCMLALYIWAQDFSGILDLIMHAMLLYYLISAVRANAKLQQLPPEELSSENDFRLEEPPAKETVFPMPKEQRTTDWEYDFSTLPQWKNRWEIPYVYDAFLSFEKADLLFCVTSVAEVTMGNYRGFLSVLENKASPRVVFTFPKGIVGPNLYPSGKEGYLCFEAYCSGKGSVMLLYSVSRKAFAVLERPSGNFAGARFSEDEETVTLVEGDGSSLPICIGSLAWLPLERLEDTLADMEKTTSNTENF